MFLHDEYFHRFGKHLLKLRNITQSGFVEFIDMTTFTQKTQRSFEL